MPQRNVSRSLSRCKAPKRRTASKSPEANHTRVSSSSKASPLPPLADRVSAKAPQPVGMPWAVKHGFQHVKKCSKRDTRFVLKTIGLSPTETPDEHNTAYGDLVVYGWPWRWLEKFARAGGDFGQLSIKPKFQGDPDIQSELRPHRFGTRCKTV